MSYTALSLAQTPPLSVPLRFFLTAPLFSIVAGLILLGYGPDLLTNRWSPPLLAATHAITLGFLASVMVGALQQLLPVLAGSPIARPRWVSMVIHLLLSLAIALMLGGWLLGEKLLLRAAWFGMALALLPFVVIVLERLLHARSRHPSIFTMGVAVAGLLVTAGLGLQQLAGYGWSSYPLVRAVTDIHLGWGVAGWIGVLVAGVAYQVVPMFQITPDYPQWLMRGYGPLLFLILFGWSLAGGIGWGVAGAVVTTTFALTTLWLQRHRRRRIADVTLDFWRVAMVSLLLAPPLWLLGEWLALPRALPLVLMIAGFGVSAVNGMLYKIVPFLIWLHLNNRVQALGRWQGRIPNMKQIIPERQARGQFRLQLAALLLLLAALFWPEWLLRPAGLLWALSAAWLLKNLFAALYLFRRIVSEAEDMG